VGEPEHSATVGYIAVTLYNRKRESGIHVFPSLRVQVSATRFRIPDITLTKQKGRGKILREPPFLCIEILSPEDRAGQMQEKLDDYLGFGVRYVWVIDPRGKKAWSYSSEGKRESSAVLATAHPQLTLADVFAAVDDELDR
jgi:Uma2 family endonuclease